MQIIVKGKNIEMTEALRDYAEEKVGKLERYLDRAIKAEVELFVEKNPKISNSQCVEVTIFTSGPVIRARESSSDMYQAIDLVYEKLEKQVKRLHGRRIDRSHNTRHNHGARRPAPVAEEETEEEAALEAKIVKTKSFLLKPMTPEEAALQMDLVGHDFFVFINAETDQTSVVYRRKDGNYGLIEPGR
jgi:putative sigma-54 modulation protein